MNIDITFIYTDLARPIAERTNPQELKSWPSPGLMHLPAAGDMVSFGDESPLFEVANRVFIWRDPDHLKVQLLLDLLEGANPDTGYTSDAG